MVKFGRASRARPHGRRVLGGLLSGLKNRGHEGSVQVRFWGADSGAVEAVLGRQMAGFWARLKPFGHAEAVSAPWLHEKMHMLVCTMLQNFRPPPPPPPPPPLPRGRKFPFASPLPG